MPWLIAIVLAIPLIVPVEARWKNPLRRKAAPRTVCVPYYEHGIGPVTICAQAPKSTN